MIEKLEKLTFCFKKYGIFYIIGMLLLFALKCFYRGANSQALLWILTPTAKWVRVLSGVFFAYEPQIGYISRDYQFLLAPSCAGVSFLVITAAVLFFSFLHRIKSIAGCTFWLFFSFGFSYFFTIVVNGIRVALAIFLPIYLRDTTFFTTFLTEKQLHTSIGIVVYFTALLLLYQTIDYAFSKQKKVNVSAPKRMWQRCLPPLFCYLLLTLILPFLRGAYKKDLPQFLQYAGLMLLLCAAVTLGFCMVSRGLRHLGKKIPLLSGWKFFH